MFVNIVPAHIERGEEERVMNKVTVNFNKIVGRIKPMHAVNNGPAYPKGTKRGNFETFTELGIPYVRNHDASLSEAYGSQHLVDIHCIFSDFSRDVSDESAYDFTLTDVYLKNIIDTGSKVFYRLGASIEHWKRKYGTVVPENFQKWAEICEHIIRHYNEGWADGFRYDIEYWEIWNEPDLDEDDALDKHTWGGTKLQFFDLYETASRHLKTQFPNLKIGGPALAYKEDWADEFLCEMKKRNAPLDFFSWHIYCTGPKPLIEKAVRMKKMLFKYGFTKTETILNEWNYVKDWSDPLQYISVIKGIKGAAFCGAVMCASQMCDSIDMLMYYDARIEKVWNGMFDSNTLLPLKGYYPFKMFDVLYRYGNACDCTSDYENLYVIGAKSENEQCAAILCYYTDNDACETLKIKLDFIGDSTKYEVFVLDKNNDAKKTLTVGANDEFVMERNTMCLFQSLEING